jgi:hypothetical protein
VQRHPHSITVTEVFLYIWIAAFAYDEFGEFQDAGVAFYQTDFWSLWDLGIIITGVAFLILRKCIVYTFLRLIGERFGGCLNTIPTILRIGAIGLLKQSDYLTDISFDTLALLALFLVPR